MKVKRRKSRVKRGAWLFILPIRLLHIFTILVPALVGIYFSLTDWSGFGPATFIGLENYRTLFEDPGFLQALRNNFKWLVFFATVPFSIALTAAFLLSQVKRGGFVYRIAYFVPYVLPAVVIGSLWKFILNPDSGITSILSNLGIPGFEKALLGQPSTSLLTIAFVDNWHYWGFLATILLVALQSVSPELYEAAKIDGANLRQQFRYVTIPGIRPTLVFMFMMTSSHWAAISYPVAPSSPFVAMAGRYSCGVGWEYRPRPVVCVWRCRGCDRPLAGGFRDGGR